VPKAKNLTTISIRREVHAKLKNLGKAGDSFNDVITKLLESKDIEVVGEPTRQPDSRRESTTTPEPQAIIVEVTR
jgi:predicted CopG family antitoxin